MKAANALLGLSALLLVLSLAPTAQAQYGQSDLEPYLEAMSEPRPLGDLPPFIPTTPSGNVSMGAIILGVQTPDDGEGTVHMLGQEPMPPLANQNGNNYVVMTDDMFEGLLQAVTLQTMGSTYQPGTFVDGNLVLAGLATIGAVALVILARGQFFGGGKSI